MVLLNQRKQIRVRVQIGKRHGNYVFTSYHVLMSQDYLNTYNPTVSTPLKKVNDLPVPSRDVTNQIIPGHGESLVSDIPDGDGKIGNLFYSVGTRHPSNLIKKWQGIFLTAFQQKMSEIAGA